jgi:hypothetical protein
MDQSSERTDAMSREKLDRKRSNLAVDIIDYLRSLYPQKPAEAVSADLDIPLGTARKWFLRQSSPNARYDRILRSFYGVA